MSSARKVGGRQAGGTSSAATVTGGDGAPGARTTSSSGAAAATSLGRNKQSVSKDSAAKDASGAFPPSGPSKVAPTDSSQQSRGTLGSGTGRKGGPQRGREESSQLKGNSRPNSPTRAQQQEQQQQLSQQQQQQQQLPGASNPIFYLKYSKELFASKVEGSEAETWGDLGRRGSIWFEHVLAGHLLVYLAVHLSSIHGSAASSVDPVLILFVSLLLVRRLVAVLCIRLAPTRQSRNSQPGHRKGSHHHHHHHSHHHHHHLQHHHHGHHHHHHHQGNSRSAASPKVPFWSLALAFAYAGFVVLLGSALVKRYSWQQLLLLFLPPILYLATAFILHLCLLVEGRAALSIPPTERSLTPSGTKDLRSVPTASSLESMGAAVTSLSPSELRGANPTVVASSSATVGPAPTAQQATTSSSTRQQRDKSGARDRSQGKSSPANRNAAEPSPFSSGKQRGERGDRGGARPQTPSSRPAAPTEGDVAQWVRTLQKWPYSFFSLLLLEAAFGAALVAVIPPACSLRAGEESMSSVAFPWVLGICSFLTNWLLLLAKEGFVSRRAMVQQVSLRLGCWHQVRLPKSPALAQTVAVWHPESIPYGEGAIVRQSGRLYVSLAKVNCSPPGTAGPTLLYILSQKPLTVGNWILAGQFMVVVCFLGTFVMSWQWELHAVLVLISLHAFHISLFFRQLCAAAERRK